MDAADRRGERRAVLGPGAGAESAAIAAAGHIFATDYAHGSIREEREAVPGYEGSGGVMVKVTKYRCDNGTWLYEGFDYEFRLLDPFGPRSRPAPILE